MKIGGKTGGTGGMARFEGRGRRTLKEGKKGSRFFWRTGGGEIGNVGNVKEKTQLKKGKKNWGFRNLSGAEERHNTEGIKDRGGPNVTECGVMGGGTQGIWQGVEKTRSPPPTKNVKPI